MTKSIEILNNIVRMPLVHGPITMISPSDTPFMDAAIAAGKLTIIDEASDFPDWVNDKLRDFD